jgi:hypothetical protein
MPFLAVDFRVVVVIAVSQDGLAVVNRQTDATGDQIIKALFDLNLEPVTARDFVRTLNTDFPAHLSKVHPANDVQKSHADHSVAPAGRRFGEGSHGSIFSGNYAPTGVNPLGWTTGPEDIIRWTGRLAWRKAPCRPEVPTVDIRHRSNSSSARTSGLAFSDGAMRSAA